MRDRCSFDEKLFPIFKYVADKKNHETMLFCKHAGSGGNSSGIDLEKLILTTRAFPFCTWYRLEATELKAFLMADLLLAKGSSLVSS